MGENRYNGVVGNGETLALIGPDLALDWFCAPRVDSAPFFAAALDPQRGGSLRLQFDQPLDVLDQEYVGRTNVLQTTNVAGSLKVSVQDFMPWRKRHLTRLIIVENQGAEPLQPHLTILVAPVSSRVSDFTCREDGEGRLLIRGSSGALCVGSPQWPGYNRPVSLGTLDPGERRFLRLGVAYGHDESEAREAWNFSFQDPVDVSLVFWQDWLKGARRIDLDDRQLEEAYYRSLLTLKLLTYEASGAILAAATASLPAVPGGSDNWDYRYCWLRDGYYAAMAFDEAGFHQEARRFYDFALLLQEEDGSWRQPLYTVDGRNPEEYIISDLEGPGGEKPVRFGNQAAHQLQLDNIGNLVHGLWHHYQATRDLSYLRRHWDAVRRAGRWLDYHWYRTEQGIWEIRERMDHWVHGKVMCCAAMEAASAIARELGYMNWGVYWFDVALNIREQVLQRGWSKERQAYLRHYGSDAPLDASVLALELYDLLPPHDPRMQQTVQALERSMLPEGDSTEERGLMMWGGLARYEGAAVPFYLTTLWLARYYLHAGNLERAEELIRTCLDSSTNLLLMAEHFDPRTSSQWGNFPQSFSHQEMVRTLLELHEARKKGAK